MMLGEVWEWTGWYVHILAMRPFRSVTWQRIFLVFQQETEVMAFYFHFIFSLISPTGCFGYVQPSSCVALISAGHFHRVFVLFPPVKPVALGEPSLHLLLSMWLTQQDNSVPGLRYGAVPLHYHAWVRASAELASWSFKFSLNEKYLPSSAWDMKNFSHFLCCGSHPIPSRTAGCLNMFLYYDGNKQRKKINCVHRYYRMYFPTQIPNHIASPVFWSVWIWGPKSLLMQMSK